MNTKATQIQRTKTGRTKRIHSTFHIEPGVRFEMERIAKEQGLSFSEVCNVACRFYANATIEKQHAESLKDVLRQIVQTDEGAARLGEIALVPNSSPISQSGLLFYNTLFDENAASHTALGSAYRFTLRGGETMEDAAFLAAGGNHSATHVDFMVGGGELDVDGVAADGSTEPVMRSGEWAFDI